MRFVHAADLHLDSPLRGLSRYEGAPTERIRLAARRALSNLVDLCIDEDAAFLVIAGDVYDGDWRDYTTGLFFAAEMSRLNAQGIRVFIVRGNHDAQSEISRKLKLPDNCHLFRRDQPETVVDKELGVALHGQSFPERVVKEDLALRYPKRVESCLNIGVLHTALTGREGHAPYAPTTETELGRRGYDYWALGHVHKREVISEDPWIVFPGNLQGRNIRETGPKGATLVEVRDRQVTSVEHRTLDVVRWERLSIELREDDEPDDLLSRFRASLETQIRELSDHLLAVRVSIEGRTRAHRVLAGDTERWEAELRAIASDFPEQVWLEKVQLNTRAPYDRDRLRGGADPVGHLLRGLDALRQSEDPLLAAARSVESLSRKLPQAAKEGPDGVRLNDADYLREVLDRIERRLVPELLLEPDP